MSQTFEPFGKYILLEKLATGGMAEVYLAKNKGADGIGKLVAIKRILPQFSENPEFIDMFKDEAKIAVNLAHSNIVSIHEFGIQSSQFFLVMDYVEGRNLRQILNKMKKSGLSFSIEQVLYIVKEVAAGLDHAHRCLDAATGKPLNITHRDMSPQNVMISFEGEVKVVDFGIAKAEIQIETTRAGTLKGKFGYMSPEQAEGQVVDLRTDIFSLGIVLWELLANDRLFVANNEINTLRKIRDCQVPSLRKINPNISPELERICNKALARDRNLRYQTAAAFHRELNRFLNRQYPDFSPHDFSVFIKTLFASEILGNRKKIIEYSRNESSSQPTPNSPMSLELMSPSAPAATNAAAPQSPTKGPQAPIELEPTNTHTDQTANTDSAYFTNEDFRPGQKTKQNAAAPLPTPHSSSEDPAHNVQQAKSEPEKKVKGAAPKPAARPPAKNSEDYGDLRFDPASQPPRAGKNETAFSVREGSFTSSNIPGYGRSRSGYTATGIRIQEPSRLTPIIQNAAMVLIGFSIVGSLWYVTDRDSFSKASEKVSTTFGSKPEKGPDEAGSADVASVPVYRVNIVSQPPSAEIWIDGKLVKDVTPTTYDFEANREYIVVIKKSGFVEWRTKIRVTRDGERIAALLQRSRIAYLDVIVEGKGEIFINGQRVAAAGPLLNFQIPADEDVSVRVYDPSTGAADESRVRIGESFSRRLTLRPRGGIFPQQIPQVQPQTTPPVNLRSATGTGGASGTASTANAGPSPTSSNKPSKPSKK